MINFLDESDGFELISSKVWLIFFVVLAVVIIGVIIFELIKKKF